MILESFISINPERFESLSQRCPALAFVSLFRILNIVRVIVRRIGPELLVYIRELHFFGRYR